MDIINQKIGIHGIGPGWGDSIIASSLPENFYKNTGNKLVDINSCFIFDYNPYVERNKPYDISLHVVNDIYNPSITEIYRHRNYQFSFPDRHFGILGFKKYYLRHSRLYIYEDLKTIHNKITVHTTGKTIGGILPDNIINQIKQNYKDYEIYQVGGLNDKKFEGSIDIRGLSFWDTCKHIAESAIYIGVDSCFLHVASSYPKVRTKCIILYADESFLEKHTALMGDAAWIDFNREYYNQYEYDVGITMSYLKV